MKAHNLALKSSWMSDRCITGEAGDIMECLGASCIIDRLQLVIMPPWLALLSTCISIYEASWLVI